MPVITRILGREPRKQHVEGTVLTMLALVAIERGDLVQGKAAVTSATLATISAYWLANVYAEVIASNRTNMGDGPGLRRAVREAALDEAHLFEPTIALLIAVVSLQLLGFSKPDAVQLMLLGGCGVLACWGYVAARGHGNTRAISLLVGLVGVGIGMLVIYAKSHLH
jgi:hypothetical protein